MKARHKLLLSLRALVAYCVLLAGLTGCSEVPNQSNSPTLQQDSQPIASDSVKEPLTPDQSSDSAATRNSESTEDSVRAKDSDATGVDQTKDTKPQDCKDPDKPCGKPCTTVSRLDTGLTMMQMGRFSSAERQFGALFVADPRDFEAAFYQTWCFMMVARSEEFFAMDRITKDIRNGTVKGTLMDSWFARSRGNLKLANKLGREALKKEPSALCYFTVAISDANPKEGVLDMDRALKLEPDNFIYIVTKANVCRDAGDLKGAQEWIDRAGKKAPKSGLVLFSLGELAKAQGNEKKSVELYQSALMAEPDLNACYVRLSEYYRKTNNKLGEAKFYTELLKKHPNHPKVLLDRGRAYYETEDFDKATADIDTLLKITDGLTERRYVNALGHMFRGHLYHRKGLSEKALGHYDMALKYYPDNIDLELITIGIRVEKLQYPEAEKLLEERFRWYSGEVTRTAGGGIDNHRKSILLSFKAMICANQSRWSETCALANEAIKLDPTNKRAYDARAKAYYAERKYPQALRDYRKIQDPHGADQRGWIASILWHTGKRKEAIAEISGYIKDHPTISTGYTTRAQYYLASGNRANAEADANAAVKAGLSSPEAHWGLTHVYMALGRRADAASELIEAVKNDTNAKSVKGKLAVAVSNMAGPEALMLALSKKTQEQPNNAQFYFLLGAVQMMAGRMDRAEQHLNKAISLDPRVGVYYLQRGILLSKADRLEEALKDLNKGIDEFKVQDPQGFYARGQSFMNIGQWARAEKDFTQAIAGLPADEAPYVERGTAYSHLHEDKKAIADFEKALTQNRETRKVLLRLGPLYEAQGQNDKAIAIYNRLLSSAQNEVQALERRGDIYMKLNRPKDAIADYDKILAMSDAFTGIFYKRGKAFEKMGRFDLAEKDFAKAKGIDTDMLGPERKSKRPSLSVHY